MLIGLIDVDGHGFPNIPLMKISSYHKAQGDTVEWVMPLFQKHYDKVYMSKVFSFTPDYEYFVDADEVHKGGSGYCIELDEGGKEVYRLERDSRLPDEIEHAFPDYSIYGITDTAYGFLTRGCPRKCPFCHTGVKDGIVSRKVADLSEFWNGQKNIVLLDQNILACKDWKDLLQQLIDSDAYVDYNGGLDIRMMTYEKAEMLKQIKTRMIHFAWDRYKDKDVIVPKLEAFRDVTGLERHRVMVYCLVNYESTLQQDLERIYTIREIGFRPYVMVYDKSNLDKRHIVRRLQRWVNNTFIFYGTKRFEDYDALTDEQREFVKGLDV